MQTLRGKENFHITGIPMSLEPNFVKAFGYVKKAAALANRDLGVLDAKIADAIAGACDRLIAGEMRDQFVTDFIQGGAGTSTNMNANEVIANLALEALGHKKGEYQYVNPNDHVNFGQSTNDIYPTAFRLALILRLDELHGRAASGCRTRFYAKSQGVRPGAEDGPHAPAGRRADVARPGVPRLGHDDRRGGAAHRRSPPVPARDQPRRDGDRHHGDRGAGLPGARDEIPVRADGHQVHPRRRPDRGDVRHRRLRAALRRAEAHVVEAHQDLQRHPAARLGPRCGFNEINLPQMQPGSSIMPGKVNPVIPEVVNQVGFLVIGLDLTVTLAASAGQLQLNVMEPVITFALFTSIATMEHAVDSLRVHCINGITANAERTRDMVLNSLGIVTVLKPSLGYKQCAEIAREGYETGKSLHDIVVEERKLLTQEKWDEVFSFENLISPKFEQ